MEEMFYASVAIVAALFAVAVAGVAWMKDRDRRRGHA